MPKGRIPLHGVLDELFGISKIDSEEKLKVLIKALREGPYFEIDFSKIKEPEEKKKPRSFRLSGII